MSRYVPHVSIPVPEEVIQRQHVIRTAREQTRLMYGEPGPHEVGTPAYEFFCNLVFDFPEAMVY